MCLEGVFSVTGRHTHSNMRQCVDYSRLNIPRRPLRVRVRASPPSAATWPADVMWAQLWRAPQGPWLRIWRATSTGARGHALDTCTGRRCAARGRAGLAQGVEQQAAGARKAPAAAPLLLQTACQLHMLQRSHAYVELPHPKG
jgi:hypothetical protein